MVFRLGFKKALLLAVVTVAVWCAVHVLRQLLFADLPTMMPQRIIRVDKPPGEGGAMASDTAAVQELGCRVPELSLDDPQLARFFHSVPPLDCAKEPNWVFVGPARTFQLDPSAVRRHGLINCSYEHFWRVNDREVARRRYDHYPSGSALLGDFFRADCTAADGAAFTNLYATVVPSAEAVRRARGRAPPSDWSGLDVYQLGFDSMSRMTFQRKMKLTYRFITEELHAVVLKGYNIVGDGTQRAFVPMLTGKTEWQLPLARKGFPDAQFVDVYPFIWKDFEKNGFVTMFSEDMARVDIFSFHLKGFDKQPTDHCMRTFFIVAEKAMHELECLGSEPLHNAFLRYAEDFFAAYPPHVPKFAIHFAGLLSHGDSNKIELSDVDTVAHLRRLRDSGQLNKTLLILMGDHGSRFAQMRATQQGMLEERLPLFAVAAPRWWRDGPGRAAWANLRLNADRLTTPFDVHATLQRVLHWREPAPADGSQRSISLWDRVPPQRSCAQAGIADHWCSCLHWRAVPAAFAQLTTELARAVVSVINNETERVRQLCAPLQLQRVEWSRMLAPADSLLHFKNDIFDLPIPNFFGRRQLVSATFQLRFWTAPGDALYEATVPYDIRIGEVRVDLRTVSHINRYGDKPHCVIDRDYFLAKWCVCYDRI